MKPIRLVLVDDSPVFLESASAIVEQCVGMKLLGVAISGADGLIAIEQLAPDLVLMDLNMPGMNGLEATQRSKSVNSSIRVMAISVQGGEDVRRAALAAGADAFVAKNDLAAGLLEHAAKWFGTDAVRARPRVLQLAGQGSKLQHMGIAPTMACFEQRGCEHE